MVAGDDHGAMRPENSQTYCRNMTNTHTHRSTDGTVTSAISVRDLRKSFKRKSALSGVSFHVAPGEILGVLGSNGAGKSTLVHVLAGIFPSDSGEVTVLGLDPRGDRTRLRRVLGVQLQEANLHGALTVDELINLHRSFYQNPHSLAHLLECVGLVDKRSVAFDKLSGGQKQRLSIALALAGKPRLVILDELTTGLDPRGRRLIWQTVESLRDDGVTVLLVSHSMDEVQRLCDRILILDSGQIAAEGAPHEVIEGAGATSLDEAFIAITGHEVDSDEDTDEGMEDSATEYTERQSNESKEGTS